MSPDAVGAGVTRGFRRLRRRRRGPAFAPLFPTGAVRWGPGNEGLGRGRVSHLGGPGSGSAPCGHDGRA